MHFIEIFLVSASIFLPSWYFIFVVIIIIIIVVPVAIVNFQLKKKTDTASKRGNNFLNVCYACYVDRIFFCSRQYRPHHRLSHKHSHAFIRWPLTPHSFNIKWSESNGTAYRSTQHAIINFVPNILLCPIKKLHQILHKLSIKYIISNGSSEKEKLSDWE